MGSTRIDKKIRKKKLGLIIIIFLLLLATFIVLLTLTDVFNVKKINILGNNKIEEKKILLASGVNIGENIFKINTNIIEKNLLLHPYIKSIKVDRKLPSTLIINITEKKELLAIEYIGSYIYLDDEGKILSILADSKHKDVPFVTGLKVEKANVDEKIVLSDYKIDDISVLAKICKLNGIYSELLKIEFIKDKKIRLYMKAGTKVALNDLNNVKYKLSFVKSMLSDLKQRNENSGTIRFDKGDNPIYVKGQ
ncbi:MAG: FtsQ-type POTRA domain-containing protein [Firmicutes bacterium]|nr:FtsQ-type POTRA domain-containing protein [Bacillota bacterium]